MLDIPVLRVRPGVLAGFHFCPGERNSDKNVRNSKLHNKNIESKLGNQNIRDMLSSVTAKTNK